MKFKLGDVVWIRWEDHYHNYTAGWADKNDRKKMGISDPLYCETVGFVVLNNKQRVALAPTFTLSDGHSNGGVAVKMKRCIVSWKVLRKAKK